MRARVSLGSRKARALRFLCVFVLVCLATCFPNFLQEDFCTKNNCGEDFLVALLHNDFFCEGEELEQSRCYRDAQAHTHMHTLNTHTYTPFHMLSHPPSNTHTHTVTHTHTHTRTHTTRLGYPTPCSEAGIPTQGRRARLSQVLHQLRRRLRLAPPPALRHLRPTHGGCCRGGRGGCAC